MSSLPRSCWRTRRRTKVKGRHTGPLDVRITSMTGQIHGVLFTSVTQHQHNRLVAHRITALQHAPRSRQKDLDTALHRMSPSLRPRRVWAANWTAELVVSTSTGTLVLERAAGSNAHPSGIRQQHHRSASARSPGQKRGEEVWADRDWPHSASPPKPS